MLANIKPVLSFISAPPLPLMSSVICAVNVISRSPDVRLSTGLIERSTNSGGVVSTLDVFSSTKPTR